MKKLGFSQHKGTTQDTKGCEFQYTCYSEKLYDAEISDFRVDREYFCYDGKGTGLINVMARDKTLKGLKFKMASM